MQNIEFGIALIILSFLTFSAMRTPSHNRRWSKDQEVLPSISTYGEHLTIHNVRQARYRSVDDYDVAYTNWTFSLTDIEKVWIGIEPFGGWSIFGLRPAHVFLSFQLKNGEYIVISPEIRKKKGDTFSPWRGFIRGYEIMYVVADERDIIQLRTSHRKNEVRLYPLTLPRDTVQSLFRSIVLKINNIHKKAVFFNTLLHSCTTNIAQHFRNAGIELPKMHILYLLPGTIDSVFHARGLIDTKLELKNARAHFCITTKAQKCAGVKNFSQCIRVM
jgi:hypothetical protein